MSLTKCLAQIGNSEAESTPSTGAAETSRVPLRSRLVNSHFRVPGACDSRTETKQVCEGQGTAAEQPRTVRSLPRQPKLTRAFGRNLNSLVWRLLRCLAVWLVGF